MRLAILGIALIGCLAADDLPRHGVIGLQVAVSDPARPGNAQTNPVKVQQAFEGGAGAAAGIQAGDLIESLNGARVDATSAFVRGIGRHLGGDVVQIGILRGSERSVRAATLKPRPYETSPYAEVIYDSVRVRGARRRTIVTRPRRSGKLPAVLFEQGLGCYSLDNTPRNEGYGAVISALEQRGFVTMRVEKTGEGDSEGPACSDLGSLPDLEAAGWLAGLRALKQYDFVDPEKVFVFAHSMGPVTGSLWLGEEKVRGFMAIETVGKIWFEYDIERARVQAVLRLAPDQTDREVREYEVCSHRFYIDKHKPDELAKEGCSDVLLPFGNVPYTYMQAVADISLGKQWKAADFPVLVVYGTASPVTTAAQSRYLADMINRMHPGRATYVEVAGMSHDLGRYESQRAYVERGSAAGPFHTGLVDVIVKWMEGVAGPLL
jgi:hypothetical protein